MTDLKGYRTVIFNIIGLLAFGVDKFLNSDIFTGNVGTISEFVLLLGNIYLRFQTTTPIGQKDA